MAPGHHQHTHYLLFLLGRYYDAALRSPLALVAGALAGGRGARPGWTSARVVRVGRRENDGQRRRPGGPAARRRRRARGSSDEGWSPPWHNNDHRRTRRWLLLNIQAVFCGWSATTIGGRRPSAHQYFHSLVSPSFFSSGAAPSASAAPSSAGTTAAGAPCDC